MPQPARRIVVALLPLLLAACGPTHMQGPSSQGHITAADAQSPGSDQGAKAQSGTSDDIPAPVTDSATVPPPAADDQQERYTVVVNGVPVKDLLFSLARDADLQIDIVGDIHGKVTLNAVKETLPRLLQRISLQAPIRYQLNGKYLKISADTPYLHTYPVPYVNLTRKASSSVDTATEVSSTGFGQNQSGGGGSSSSGGGAGSGGSNNSSTKLENESDNRFWKTLEDNLAGILNVPVHEDKGGKPADEGRYIMVNREAGFITVRATQQQQKEVQRYLDRVIASARRQVLIEATVVEVKLNDEYQSGVDWSLLAKKASGFDLVQNMTGTALGGAFNVPSPSNPGSPNLTIGYTNPDTGQGSFQSTIKLLDEFGNVHVMSSPKIMALNNQLAILKVVDNRVYFTIDVQQTTNANVSNTTFQTNINTVPVGLIMTVTPYIGSSDEVLLNVRPTVSRILGYRDDPNPELAKAGVDNQVPEIQVREMESMLRVHSGQVAVIGGLMQDTVDKTKRSVPGLSDLPLIGNLFTYRDDQKSKTELIIFLRPTVIKEPSLKGDFRAFRKYLPGDDASGAANAAQNVEPASAAGMNADGENTQDGDGHRP